jgi:hypothetical protein
MNKTNKKVKAQVVEEIKKKRDYDYTTLQDAVVGQIVNFYGVVLDASRPHRSYKSDKFLCSLKMADLSSTIDHSGIAETISVVIFANKAEDLPIC